MLRGISVAVTLSVAFAQAPKAPQSFEVASVKRAPAQDPSRMMMGANGGPGAADPGRMTFENLTLKSLIMRAYNVRMFQVSGPPWIENDRYDIVAKLPPGATKEDVRVMLQNLLAERFKLQLHREIHDAPIYVLSVAKGGLKIKESAAQDGDGQSGPRSLAGGLHVARDNGRIRLQGVVVTAAPLVDFLAANLYRPVVDKTGLTGTYEITLDFSSEGLATMRGWPMGSPTGAASSIETGHDAADSGPSIITALEEQLGLKLESRKGPVDLLVIDRADKSPIEN